MKRFEIQLNIDEIGFEGDIESYLVSETYYVSEKLYREFETYFKDILAKQKG